MDKSKTSFKLTLKEKITHTTASHRRIILWDLELVKTIGKTALAFREDYNIVDVPNAISKINHREMIIYSSYPNQYTVLDKDGIPRQTVKYWLAEYAPKALGVAI